MKVYVLIHTWNTPHNEGTEILGVYAADAIEKARADMRRSAAAVERDYGGDIWQDDFTWKDENSIHMGFDPQVSYELATVYGWDILEEEVQS